MKVDFETNETGIFNPCNVSQATVDRLPHSDHFKAIYKRRDCVPIEPTKDDQCGAFMNITAMLDSGELRIYGGEEATEKLLQCLSVFLFRSTGETRPHQDDDLTEQPINIASGMLQMSGTLGKVAQFASGFTQSTGIDPLNDDDFKTILGTFMVDMVRALDGERIEFLRDSDKAIFYGLLSVALIRVNGREPQVSHVTVH